MPSRLVIVMVLSAVLLGACAGDDISDPTSLVTEAAETSTTSSTPTTVAGTTTLTTSPAGDAPVTVAPDDPAVGFVALVEEAVIETRFAGLPLEEPEVFLATGRLFCDLLESGVDAETVLTRYIEELEGVGIEEASDDATVLAGALLGAAVAVMCPDMASLIPTDPVPGE